MTEPRPNDERVIAKLLSLPRESLSEVEHFVDFLQERRLERELFVATAKLSEQRLNEVWDNADDDAYDRL